MVAFLVSAEHHNVFKFVSLPQIYLRLCCLCRWKRNEKSGIFIEHNLRKDFWITTTYKGHLLSYKGHLLSSSISCGPSLALENHK